MNRSRMTVSILVGIAAIILAISVVSFSAANEKPPTAPSAPQTSVPDNTNSHHIPMPGTITGVKKTSSEANLISLSWSPYGGATGYYVYICEPAVSDNYVLISTVTQPKAELMNLKDTTAYKIKISAFKNSNGAICESTPAVLSTATQAADVASIDSLSSS